MTAVLAIDRRAKPVSLTRTLPGAYNADGDYIPGAPASSNILAVVQPVSGSMLRDIPEGLRSEARVALWSRSQLLLDDQVVLPDGKYRIVFVWNRSVDGAFYRALCGLLQPEASAHVW